MRRATLLVLLLSAGAWGQDGGVLVPPQLVTDSPARFPADAGLVGGADGGAVAEVALELTVDEQGEVIDARVLEESGSVPEAFARAALHAAVGLRFAPATVDGQAQAVRLRFSYLFTPPQPLPPRREPYAVVTGVVRSRGNRAPVAFATITSDDGPRALTDEQGNFRLEVKPGHRWIWVQAPAYVAEPFEEQLPANKQLTVIYTLRPRQVNPYETVVRGDRERTEVARVELRDAEVREVPGTFGDPFRVVMLLPGVGSIASGVSYPVVRGSSPASTGYFLDGVRVPQLFHVFLGPAVVHPDFVEGIDFHPGGAPVKYGRLLSGVVEGRITRPRTEGLRLSAYVDLLNAGLLAELPIAATDTQVSLAGRISYTPLMIAAATAIAAPPGSPKLIANFWDYQARVEQGVLGGKLRLFAFGSSDTFGTEGDKKDPLSSSMLQELIFHRVDARYRHRLGVGEAELGFTFGADLIELRNSLPSYDTFPQNVCAGGMCENATEPKPNGRRENIASIYQTTVGGRAKWSAELTDEWSATFGFAVEYVRAGFSQTTAITLDARPDERLETVLDTPAARATISSGYLELPWRPSGASRVRLVPGVRFDHWFLKPDFSVCSVDPRLAAFWNLTDELELHASVGAYHQAPTFLINLPVVDVASVRSGLQEAVQASVGAQWKFWGGLELSGDAYVNVIPRSIEIGIFDDERVSASELDPNQPARPSSSGTRGLAYGVEAMLRWPQQGHFFGWVTASLSRSQRRATFTRYDEAGKAQGRDTADVPYAFDQTFIANAVLSYRFDNGISVGATLHFNTGRPESGELTSRTRRPNEEGSKFIPISRDQVDRLPAFFRMDLRLAKTWLTDKLSVELFLDVLNVLVRSEVLAFDYDNSTMTKTPTSVPIIIPNLGLKVRY